MLSIDLKSMLDEAVRLAQEGCIEASRDVLNSIRLRLKIENNPDIAVRVMAIEGICLEYSGLNDLSRDRLARAEALAAQYSSLSAKQFVTSWLALSQYNGGDILGSIRTLGRLSSQIASAQDDVKFRVASLVAIVAAYSGRRDVEQVWFDLSRAEAAKCKNPGMTSGLLYSIASARLVTSLVERRGFSDLQCLPQNSTELRYLRSAENYDRLVGARNQYGLHKLLQAQCLTLERNYDLAICYLDDFISSDCQTRNSEYAKARFERAWCQLELGIFQDEASVFDKLLEFLKDVDDLSIAHRTMSKIYAHLKQSALADFHCGLAEGYSSDFDVTKQSISRELASQGLTTVPLNWLSSSK